MLWMGTRIGISFVRLTRSPNMDEIRVSQKNKVVWPLD